MCTESKDNESCDLCTHEFEAKLTAGEVWAGAGDANIACCGTMSCPFSHRSDRPDCKVCRIVQAKAYDLGLAAAPKAEPAMTTEPEPERAFQRLSREYIAQWTNNDKWKTVPWSELVEEWSGSIHRIRTFFNATLVEAQDKGMWRGIEALKEKE